MVAGPSSSINKPSTAVVDRREIKLGNQISQRSNIYKRFYLLG